MQPKSNEQIYGKRASKSMTRSTLRRKSESEMNLLSRQSHFSSYYINNTCKHQQTSHFTTNGSSKQQDYRHVKNSSQLFGQAVINAGNVIKPSYNGGNEQRNHILGQTSNILPYSSGNQSQNQTIKAPLVMMGSSSTTNFTDSNRRLKQYLNKANRSRQADTNNSDHNNQKKLYTWNSISTIDLKKSQSIGALL